MPRQTDFFSNMVEPLNAGYYNYSNYVAPFTNAPNPPRVDFLHTGHKELPGGKANPLNWAGPLTMARIRSGTRSITHGPWATQFTDNGAPPPKYFRKTRTGGLQEVRYGGEAAETGSEAWHNLGIIRRSYYEMWAPRSWVRGPAIQAFDPYVGDVPNWLFFGNKEIGTARLGKPLENQLRKIGRGGGEEINPNSWVRRTGLLNEEGNLSHIWDPRMLSRLSAISDYGAMSTLDAGQKTNLVNYLKTSRNSGIADALEATNTPITGDMAAQAMRLGYVGALSGRLMGGMEGLQGGGRELGAYASESVRAGLQWGQNVRAMVTDDQGQLMSYKDIMNRSSQAAATSESEAAVSQAGESALKAAGTEVGDKVATNAAKQLAARVGVGLAEKLGAAAAFAGLNPIADALAVYGIASATLEVGKFAAEAIGSEVKDAATSFRGSIGKSPFGMGYRDTSAAASSRQRALLAISSSRLNAKSVFGNEGSMMYAHFG